MSIFSPLRAAALTLLLGAALPVAMTGPALTQSTAPSAGAEERLAALSEIFRIDPMLEVLKAEGLDYGADLDADLLDGLGGPVWLAKVGAVYDMARMRATYDRVMLAELGGNTEALAGMEAFFATDLGGKVMDLELEARRALMDDTVEAAAELAYEELQREGGARMAALTDFALINDLVESNVMGALNANLGLYMGLDAEGAFDGEMTEEQMLAEVWGAEADVRAETEAWLFPFLNLAYQPLTVEELQEYVEFSRSTAGQQMNAAMFMAFDAVFSEISYDLGRALGREMQGQSL